MVKSKSGLVRLIVMGLAIGLWIVDSIAVRRRVISKMRRHRTAHCRRTLSRIALVARRGWLISARLLGRPVSTRFQAANGLATSSCRAGIPASRSAMAGHVCHASRRSRSHVVVDARLSIRCAIKARRTKHRSVSACARQRSIVGVMLVLRDAAPARERRSNVRLRSAS